MIDIVVSTGAIVVDQDFFEGLGFNHYRGFINVDDNKLRELMIDRIYDTFIDEEDLRVCDMTIYEIAISMKPGHIPLENLSMKWGNILKKKVKYCRQWETKIS